MFWQLVLVKRTSENSLRVVIPFLNSQYGHFWYLGHKGRTNIGIFKLESISYAIESENFKGLEVWNSEQFKSIDDTKIRIRKV